MDLLRSPLGLYKSAMATNIVITETIRYKQLHTHHVLSRGFRFHLDNGKKRSLGKI